jgi:flagellar hook-length control protein FliK
MREQGNAEIVRQSTVVLRNADSGEIRLVLKPESLGGVRIRVQLQDNHIAGRIVVENNSVREMFQDNLDALTRAFRESGYETGSLDVEVRDRGGNGRRRQAGTSPSGRLVRELEDSVPTVASLGSPEALVDVFV